MLSAGRNYEIHHSLRIDCRGPKEKLVPKIFTPQWHHCVSVMIWGQLRLFGLENKLKISSYLEKNSYNNILTLETKYLLKCESFVV